MTCYVLHVNLPHAIEAKHKSTDRTWTLDLQTLNRTLYQWATETGWRIWYKGNSVKSNCCLVGRISSRICKSCYKRKQKKELMLYKFGLFEIHFADLWFCYLRRLGYRNYRKGNSNFLDWLAFLFKIQTWNRLIQWL